MRRRRRCAGGGGAASLPVPLQLGALLWFDPGMHVSTSAFRVTSWVDRVASETVSQPVGASRPIYNTADPSMGGRPSLGFNTTNPDFLYGAMGANYTGAPRTFALTLYWPLAALQVPAAFTNSGGPAFEQIPRTDAGGNMKLYKRNNVSTTLAAPSQAFPPVPARGYCIIADDGAGNATVETPAGITASAVVPVDPTTTDTLSVGAASALGGTAFGGSIGHVLVLPALGAGDYAALKAWLASEVS